MKVYFLLDKSGSMAANWQETIQSVNAYVKELKDANIQIAAFDSISYDVVRDTHVNGFKPIESYEVKPSGFTSLYDSFTKIAGEAERNADPKTLFVVMTDGEENNSKVATQATVKSLISKFENENKWPVIFLGANFDKASLHKHYGEVFDPETARSTRGMAKGSYTVNTVSLGAATQSWSEGTIDRKGLYSG